MHTPARTIVSLLSLIALPRLAAGAAPLVRVALGIA